MLNYNTQINMKQTFKKFEFKFIHLPLQQITNE